MRTVLDTSLSYKPTITTVRAKQEYERNTKNDVDREIFSLDRYIQLLIEGQTVAIDMLFCPGNMIISKETEIFTHIFNNRHELLNKNVNAFVGYAKQQAAKYGQKGFRIHALKLVLDHLKENRDKVYRLGECNLEAWVPAQNDKNISIEFLKSPKGQIEPYLNICDKKLAFHATVKYALEHLDRRYKEYGQRAILAEKNYGINWKALSHAVRVNAEAKELMETSFVTFPRPEKSLLLQIKMGQKPYKEVAEIIDDGLKSLLLASSQSGLRENPNFEWAEDFVYNIYSHITHADRSPVYHPA